VLGKNIFKELRVAAAPLDVAAEPPVEKGLMPRSSSVR
jgi:hypothetical protein